MLNRFFQRFFNLSCQILNDQFLSDSHPLHAYALPSIAKPRFKKITPWFKYSAYSSATLASVGCVSRAPSDCELDKRAGNYPPSFCDKNAAQKNLPRSLQAQGVSDTVGQNKSFVIPVREGPVVKKIWLPDQILEGGHWMQGTWLFIEVEPSKWVGKISTTPEPESSVSQTSQSVNPLVSSASVEKVGAENAGLRNSKAHFKSHFRSRLRPKGARKILAKAQSRGVK